MARIVYAFTAMMLISAMAMQNASGIVTVEISEVDFAENEDMGLINVRVIKQGVNSGRLAFTLTSFTYDEFIANGFVLSSEQRAKNLPTAAQSADTVNQKKDFIASSKRVVFPANSDTAVEVEATFDVVVDGILEDEEFFVVVLALDVNGSDPNPGVEILLNTTLCYIRNDDSVTISFNEDSFTVSEGDGTLDSLISVILTGESEIELSIPLQLLSGTAQQGVNLDYTAGTLDRTLVFAPGENHSQSIPFTVNQDSIAEMRETIKLHIPQTTSARYTATPFDITTVTIIDDDVLVFGFERTEYTVGEEDGSVEVCVRIKAPNDIAVTGVALLSTMNGTALAIHDYDPISNSPVAVNALKVRFCQNITIVDDTVSEPTSRFSLQLIPFNRGFEQIVSLNTTTIIIIDNDGCNCSTNIPVTNCSTNITVTNCTTNTPETVDICVNTVSKGSFIAALVILLIIVIVLICIIILLGLLLCYKHHKDSEKKYKQYSMQQQEESIPTQCH